MRKTPLKRKTRLRAKGKPRFKKGRDPRFLEFVRSLPCLISCRVPHMCGGVGDRRRVEAAHVRTRGSGGVDRGNVVPLCPRAHEEQEGHNEEFEARYHVDLVSAARQLARLFEMATA